MPDSFMQLVAAMRQAQKRYFAERSQAALRESKRLEREVDSRIDESLTIEAAMQLALDA